MEKIKSWKVIGQSLLSFTFKADQSQFLLPFEPDSNGSRLSIAIGGKIRCASPPIGHATSRPEPVGSKAKTFSKALSDIFVLFLM